MAFGGGPSILRVGSVKSIPVAQEGEMYCLKWHTFQSYFTKGLKTLFLERDTEETDVTLGAEGRHVRAHRWLLSICSPYFKRLFSASPDKKSSHVVILNRVKFRDLENLVYFMYNGEVKVATDSELQGFLQVGELLEVEGLTRCDTPAETVSAPPSTYGQDSGPSISTASSNPTSSSGPKIQGSHGLKGATRSSPTLTPTINKSKNISLSSGPPAKRQKTFPEDPNTVNTKSFNLLTPIATMSTNEDENNMGYPEDNAVPLRDPLAFDASLMTGETSECQDGEDPLSLLEGNDETDEVMIDVQPFFKNELAYVDDDEQAEDSHDVGHDEDAYIRTDSRLKNDIGEGSYQEDSRIHIKGGLSDRPGPSSEITGRTRPAEKAGIESPGINSTSSGLERKTSHVAKTVPSSKSRVWDYFTRQPSGYTNCRFCGLKSSKFTSGMWYHLKRYHPKEAKD